MIFRLFFITIVLVAIHNISFCQTNSKFDRASSLEFQLEERHLNYIYDFALNSALHQYEIAGYSRILTNPSYSSLSLSGDKAYILTDVLPMDSIALKRFSGFDNIETFKFFKDGHEMIDNIPFISQYILKVLPPLGIDTLRNLSFLQKPSAESAAPEIAIIFSNIYFYNTFLYIKVGIAHHRSSSISSISNAAHIFEFEWCEAKDIVYPRRVTSPVFHLPQGLRNPSVDIPSHECRPSHGN